MAEENKLTVRIVGIVYRNDDNGYSICTVQEKNTGEFTAVGCMPSVSEGERINISGKWVTHPIYGEQFSVDYYENVVPTETDDILTYLSSGVVRGVRAATAEKLVEAFGADTLNIMMTTPERMTEIKGITAKRAEKIHDSLAEVQAMQNIVVFLQKYGISVNLAVKVHAEFGAAAVKMISANPYILADEIDGISFARADDIAFKMGLPKNSKERISSGIRYILQNAAYSAGHTYMTKDVLFATAVRILGVTPAEVESGAAELILKKKIHAEDINAERRYYLTPLYRAEEYTAKRLVAISRGEQKFAMTPEKADEEITEFEEEHAMNLADKQKEAVRQSLTSGVLILTGGPGTGKTTTINTIIALLEKAKLSIVLAAPTGRAAKRMSEVTGREAKTIHRLLGATVSERDMNIFDKDESDPLDADVVIIDEVSMIDTQLMQALLKAVKPGAKLILSGDSDQLPSVGPGNVLRDIVSTNALATVRLDHVFRQAQESLIVVNAHKINNGEAPILTEKKRDFFFMRRTQAENALATIADLYQTRLPKSYGVEPLTSIQVLSPTKKGLLGTVNINKVLQSRVNPEDILKSEYVFGDTVYRVGDKVMQTKNNYDIVYETDTGKVGMGIFNGDMGIIRDIDTREKVIHILFDDDKNVEYPFSSLEDLDLAYAVTVHKSQGSEFPFVIMPVMDFPPMLMYRNLFYTAVTRAKDMVILVGREDCIMKMVNSGEKNKRMTGLAERIEKFFSTGEQVVI